MLYAVLSLFRNKPVNLVVKFGGISLGICPELRQVRLVGKTETEEAVAIEKVVILEVGWIYSI